jgi:hypothetical protein
MAIDGKWNVTVQSPIGAQKSEFTFSSNGATLTGAQGGTPITDGKVDGDNVSWSAAITSPMPMTLSFAGTVTGDSLSGTVKAGNFGAFPFSGSRA